MAKVGEKSRSRPSIIEMMVVIGILVILAATALTLASNFRDRPREVIPASGQVRPETAAADTSSQWSAFIGETLARNTD